MNKFLKRIFHYKKTLKFYIKRLALKTIKFKKNIQKTKKKKILHFKRIQFDRRVK